MLLTPRQIKSCTVCGQQYQAFQTTQKVCSTRCAIAHKRVTETRKAARQAKGRLEGNDRQRSLQKAQQAFNSFIRIRDAGKGCISCGITTGQFHAGHYRTTKAASQLRFNTFNCHLQCAQCNNHKSGNITEYRKALKARIGSDRLYALEMDNRQVKYSIEYLDRLARIFRKRARIYRNIRAV